MLKDTLKWRSVYKPEEIRWVSFVFDLVLMILVHKYCFNLIQGDVNDDSG